MEEIRQDQVTRPLLVTLKELRLQKAQQVIDELFIAANSDQRLFEKLEAAISPEKLVEIAFTGNNPCSLTL
ncbi:hypothetical protein [Coleofasciculus sp. F4-SAH-05]|uniref:hypothetical protein n=1 Tax=Coleofasciculus sp. F4-SAH-05 TaxID=3069525 RepID=UPI004063CED9